MTKLAWVALVAILLAASSAALAEEEAGHWYTDFDEAVAAAKEEGKDLLVDFTGSDWCGWCIRLHDEVFKHEAFLKPTLESFVLVALDFPRGEKAQAKVPNPERNNELQMKYGVRGFPSILLVTADGDVYGRTGYQQGGPEKYVEHLKDLREKGLMALKAVNALQKELDGAKAEEKAAVLAKVIEKLEGMTAGETGVEKVARMARTAFTADAKNEQGLKLRVVEALLKSGQVDAEIYAAAGSLDAKNASGLLERALMAWSGTVGTEAQIPPVAKAIEAFAELGVVKEKERCAHLFANCAFWNHKFLKNPEAAKKLARKVKELEPSPNPRLKGLLDQILGEEE